MHGPPRWAAKYQGIPFVERGSAFAGCHCWGLVRLVFRGERHIELPAHAEISATEALAAARAMKTAARSPAWPAVAANEWQDFDVVLIAAYERTRGKLLRYGGHVGVVAGRYVLHVEQDIESQCVAPSDPAICHRIISVHRFHA